MSQAFDLAWLDPDKILSWPFKSIEVLADTKYREIIEEEFDYFKALRSDSDNKIVLKIGTSEELFADGFLIEYVNGDIYIFANQEEGLLYGFYHIVQSLMKDSELELKDKKINNPSNRIRMINHWDNFDGSVERGYAGRSLFFENNQFSYSEIRIKHYARLLASVGINALTINNVNVHSEETYFVTERYIDEVAKLATIFGTYGIKLYLSINYAAPIELGILNTADPLESDVKEFWNDTFEFIYSRIPTFGGVVVKADSENRPGPFTYNRNHAEGANMLAEAIEPYGGFVFWRCFVYNNKQDWRDRKTDRARAAYDNFHKLDGQFADNVILQIKNGPMDFQVREPISPLIGAIPNTNQALELQITQEYTGQQKHIFYLLPMWKEILDFDTYANGEGSTIQKVLQNHFANPLLSSIVTAVVNVGRDFNWTGNKLAQSNLYGYGRIIWDSSLSPEQILEDWLSITFTLPSNKQKELFEMLIMSGEIYEKYTAPLGIGWMVKPHYHYDPDINGYEYDMWGTYHYSDRNGLGVDRTLKTGTGYTRQYFDENFEIYEDVNKCPDELILFFHHLPYDYKLKSGKTIIQHIYDSHFEGFEEVEKMVDKWNSFKEFIEEKDYINIKERLEEQLRSSREWKDQINSYYYRFSGIEDQHGRKIY